MGVTGGFKTDKGGTSCPGMGPPGPGRKSFQLGQGKMYLPFYPGNVLFQEKKKFLALGGAPLLCTYSSHDVPIECSCLNPKSACLGVPSFVTMALPPMVCGPAFVYPIPVMRPGLYLQHA